MQPSSVSRRRPDSWCRCGPLGGMPVLNGLQNWAPVPPLCSRVLYLSGWLPNHCLFPSGLRCSLALSGKQDCIPRVYRIMCIPQLLAQVENWHLLPFAFVVRARTTASAIKACHIQDPTMTCSHQAFAPSYINPGRARTTASARHTAALTSWPTWPAPAPRSRCSRCGCLRQRWDCNVCCGTLSGTRCGTLQPYTPSSGCALDSHQADCLSKHQASIGWSLLEFCN